MQCRNVTQQAERKCCLFYSAFIVIQCFNDSYENLGGGGGVGELWWPNG